MEVKWKLLFDVTQIKCSSWQRNCICDGKHMAVQLSESWSCYKPNVNSTHTGIKVSVPQNSKS